MGIELQSGYEAFFEGNIDQMETSIHNARSLLGKAEELAPYTDPQLELAPWRKTPFNFILYKGTLVKLRNLLTDLQTISLIMSFHSIAATGAKGEDKSREKPYLLQIMDSKPAMAVMKNDFMGTLATCFKILKVVLEHT